ncbi:MAG: response regulator transcription factor [Rhodocyclaceae bacterium]|nr:response regulator transcription factor [Rhodocyclaceae bacterium]MDZ4214952.1 response regulator transcription factor [Rhodocyclaceae bacterium]
MIRILLVDDHAMIREALRMVLEKDSEIHVAEAGDGETALRMAAEWQPEIVIMDVSMPGMSGIEATQQLLARNPDIKVLALSTYNEPAIVQQMLEIGAKGYISKSEAGAELVQGIRRIRAGFNYLCPLAAGLLAGSLHKPAVLPTENTTLTTRERQIATLLAEGKTAKEAAKQMNISANTVDVHRRNLMRKLNLHSGVELTRHAIRTGLIAP